MTALFALAIRIGRYRAAFKCVEALGRIIIRGQSGGAYISRAAR